MELQNTTLDDIASVIGFSATMRLVAWFGDEGNVYVPGQAEEGQLLVKLIGLPAARKLSQEWPLEHLSVPRLTSHEEDSKKRVIGRMLERGFTFRMVSTAMRLSERRVQQICRELEAEELIPVITPKKGV